MSKNCALNEGVHILESYDKKMDCLFVKLEESNKATTIYLSAHFSPNTYLFLSYPPPPLRPKKICNLANFEFRLGSYTRLKTAGLHFY